MAIKINNTIVIDNNRNIQNIGIITATNFSGSLTGNINSSGISTISNVIVGNGTTELIVNGSTRITGTLVSSAGTLGSNGNGTRTIQSGGSPTGGSDGDIYYIY